MTDIITELEAPPSDAGLPLDKSFSYLIAAIKRTGGEAQLRVAAHIRFITGGKINSLGVYHAASTIVPADKQATYKVCFNALIANKGKPDYTKLKGSVGGGAAQVEQQSGAPNPRTTTVQGAPQSEEEPSEPKVRRPARSVKPAETDSDIEVSADEASDPLTRAIIETVKKHVRVNAGLDEKRVTEIAQEVSAQDKLDIAQTVDGMLEKVPDIIKKEMKNGAFPTDRVTKLIEEAMANMVHRVELITPDGSVKPVKGLTHELFPVLVQMAQPRRVNILMVGPTGSGKTTAGEQLSKAMELDFYFNGAIDTEYKLKGFIDAHGKLVSPQFRKAFEKGGVYLFDEVDASLPAAVLAFNAALSNHYCDFPDGKIERHKDCIIIAAGNTWLGGGTFDYVGRMKQDAAFADRFATLHWPIDEKLETAVASNKEWCQFVQTARANAVRHGLKVIISPRATFFGELLLASKVDRKQVILSCVKKGCSDDQWKQINPEA